MVHVDKTSHAPPLSPNWSLAICLISLFTGHHHYILAYHILTIIFGWGRDCFQHQYNVPLYFMRIFDTFFFRPNQGFISSTVLCTFYSAGGLFGRRNNAIHRTAHRPSRSSPPRQWQICFSARVRSVWRGKQFVGHFVALL